jgi:opacity protein-like surface antigen
MKKLIASAAALAALVVPAAAQADTANVSVTCSGKYAAAHFKWSDFGNLPQFPTTTVVDNGVIRYKGSMPLFSNGATLDVGRILLAPGVHYLRARTTWSNGSVVSTTVRCEA